MIPCELCQQPAGEILYQDEKLWIVLIDDSDYPGFCRVIWKEHIREMTDLAPENRQHLFDWVMRTEQALRQTMNPDKINLASLGNMVPHLHWHVIPRFSDDPHFPAPIWATAKRPASRQPQPDLAKSLKAVLLKTL